MAFRRFTWPPELGYAERREIVADLLVASGIAAGSEFVSPAVRDYLAACRIVRHQERGPGWWRTRGHLAPQAIWPWPDAGLELYLAALWWRDAKPAVERRLKRLVHERHRDPNIRFVIELIRRDLVPGGEIRDHVVELLHRELGGGQGEEGPWAATAGWLYRLDPGAAIVELENVVRIPGPSMTSRRRFAAVRELASYEPAREEKNLRILAGNLTGVPRTSSTRPG